MKVLEKLKNFELTPHIDKSAPSVIQPSRKIPYNLRQKLLQKLIELEENDIIEKVRGPTTWVSLLVIVSKRSGNIHIIVDMRVANQVIKRACDFLKLDLCLGYYQLGLDAASQEITTFSTPFRLCRYKRLTLEVTSAPEHYQQTLEGKVFYDLQKCA